MSGNEVLVSIVIPTYNRAHLIGETIQSVIDQTYSHWELIIVDDGSTDHLEIAINRFEDDRIVYYRLAHCGVIRKVRNFGMSYANGDYIAFLDSDDLWLPHKLDFQLSLLKKYPQAAFTFSNVEQFGERAISLPALETFFIGNVFIAQLIEERFVLYPTSFLFKKDALLAAGKIDENVSGGDIDSFLRIAWKFEGIFTGESLVRIRKHDQNVSLEREVIFSYENLGMIEKFFFEGLLTHKQYTRVASKQLYKLGLLFLRRRRPKEAMKIFLKFSNLTPLNYKGWIRFAQSAWRTLL